MQYVNEVLFKIKIMLHLKKKKGIANSLIKKMNGVYNRRDKRDTFVNRKSDLILWKMDQVDKNEKIDIIEKIEKNWRKLTKIDEKMTNMT
jgi:hypothetical protein